MLCKVLRLIEGTERRYMPGDVVDAERWRKMNRESLIQHRYLLPLPISREEALTQHPQRKKEKEVG